MMGIDEKLFPLARIDCIGGYGDGGGSVIREIYVSYRADNCG